MKNLTELLSCAAGNPPAAHEAVEADLIRGRRALRQRRARRGATPLLFATVGASAIALGDLRKPGQAAPPHAVIATPTPPGSAAATPAIRLVAYWGEQPSGYRVGYVPQGWEVQGADPFALTIAPVRFPDQHPASFSGKLVVMLRSGDDTGTPQGGRLPVGQRTGYLSRAEATAVLTYQDSGGNWLQVQVPPSLRWTDQQIAQFGAGVEVTGDAQPGVG